MERRKAMATAAAASATAAAAVMAVGANFGLFGLSTAARAAKAAPIASPGTTTVETIYVDVPASGPATAQASPALVAQPAAQTRPEPITHSSASALRGGGGDDERFEDD